MKSSIDAFQDRHDDHNWSSEGLAHEEAIDHWKNHWAHRNPTPIIVSLREPSNFSAKLIHFGLGQLRLLRLTAPPQRLVNGIKRGQFGASSRRVHLLYMLEGVIHGKIDDKPFTTHAGEFVMLDNFHNYDLTMKTKHEVIDLVMPIPWMERHLADPVGHLGKSLSMSKGWAPPLGALLETLTTRMDKCPQPRPMIAEKLGGLLALATSGHDGPGKTQRSQLTLRVLEHIETEYPNVELGPDLVANRLGISKRYMQSLLSKEGTSFVQVLNQTRLDKASDMLADPRLNSLSIAEVAYRCGILDSSYFTRLFRRRFEVSPRSWREGQSKK